MLRIENKSCSLYPYAWIHGFSPVCFGLRESINMVGKIFAIVDFQILSDPCWPLRLSQTDPKNKHFLFGTYPKLTQIN